MYLGQGGAVSAVTFDAALVGLLQQIVCFGIVLLQPGQQGGAEIPGYAVVIVSDLIDPALVVENTRRCVGCLTLEVDPGIPVVPGACRLLLFYCFEPCIFPGWLVKMAVDANVLF